MNPLAHRVYNAMPASLRSAAATVRGYYLRSWRYGAETQQLVMAALERDSWNPEEWDRWKSHRLSRILVRASERVPFYRDYWSGRTHSRADVENLENWPILEKENLRQQTTAFLADDCSPKSMISIHTSGTSGKPLTLWRSRQTNREWYALFEARCRRWYGLTHSTRWANVGGQLVTPVDRREPPFWVWNQALSQLYMSSYHLAPDLIPHYLQALADRRIEYLFGYSSSLFALAQGALRDQAGQWAKTLRLRVAMTNAEPILAHQRETIREAFGCPVRETYGMAEIAAAASECEAGQLHEWPDAGHVEILDRGLPVRTGAAGDLVATCLLNPDMPLIRYRVGDRVSRPGVGNLCDCGRMLPRFQSIEGRVDDMLFTADGRAVGRLDPVFKADLPILEAQIVQESLRQVALRYVPAPGFSQRHAESIAEKIRERMGPVNVRFESVAEIPRGPNGKFRAVVCQIPQSQRPASL